MADVNGPMITIIDAYLNSYNFVWAVFLRVFGELMQVQNGRWIAFD